MTAIKSYTDIEQSRRLSKILEVDTADYYYPITYIEESINKYLMCYIKPYIGRLSDIEDSVDTRLYVPCWSLAALLDVIPERIIKNYYAPNLQKENGKYSIAYGDDELLCIADNPIDACVAMVEKLNELKVL